jgi:hypothetical protein
MHISASFGKKHVLDAAIAALRYGK